MTLSKCNYDNRLILTALVRWLTNTSTSAIAEGPRDALSQLKSCQLLHNCTKNHI